MKKLFLTTAMVLALATTPAFANDYGNHERHGYLMEAIAKLPKDKAESARASFKELRESNREIREQIIELKQEQRDILTDTYFNKSAYLLKAEKIAALKSEIAENRAQVIASIADNLTQEERQNLVDSFKEQGNFGHNYKENKKNETRAK